MVALERASGAGLFPNVEVTLTDDLRFTSLTRPAEAEAITLLSNGTREQVAVLVRLAYVERLRNAASQLCLFWTMLWRLRIERRELMCNLLTNAAASVQTSLSPLKTRM